MKALYIHGAFSAFKPDSEKVKNLQNEFEVVGVNYGMESSFPENKAMMINFCKENSVDFVVGTSLGGLYAAEVAVELSIPAVMINPCVEPVMSLNSLMPNDGSLTMQNFATGKQETLTQEVISTYPEKAEVTPKCIIFVGMKDDLIDSSKTIDMFSDTAKIISDENEDHYWEFFNNNEKILMHLSSI